MVAVQHHRGPDDRGVYVNEDRTVGLGHNRLSIIDLSPAGHQPMSNHDGTLWIVYNGEIYNYVELRAELHSRYPSRRGPTRSCCQSRGSGRTPSGGNGAVENDR